MRKSRWIVYVGAATAGLVVVAIAALYGLVSRVPGAYRPLRLDSAQKHQAAQRFADRLQEFWNRAPVGEGVQWRFSEDELNRYLASADRIAANAPGGRSGRVDVAMEDIGLADPVVDLRPGRVVLMIRSTRYDKVLSAAVDISLSADGERMSVSLGAARVGGLPIPASMVSERLGALADPLAGPSGEDGGSRVGGLSHRDVTDALAAIVAALDDGPVPAELPRPVNNNRVRITAIAIDDEALTLRVGPVDSAR